MEFKEYFEANYGVSKGEILEDASTIISFVEEFLRLQQEEKPTYEGVIKPVMKYLCENHHPHTTIIVSGTESELLEAKQNFNTEEFIVD